MADPGQRVPLEAAERRQKAREAVDLVDRARGNSEPHMANQVLLHAVHDGVDAIDLYEAIVEKHGR